MAPGPESTTPLAFSSRAIGMTYTSHTRLGQGTPGHRSRHAFRHPNTLPTECKALSTGATHRHSAKAAACEGEDGGHGAVVSLVRAAWTSPLWAGKCQRMLNTPT